MDIASLDKLDEQNRMADLGTYIDEMPVVDNGGDFQFDDLEYFLREHEGGVSFDYVDPRVPKPSLHNMSSSKEGAHQGQHIIKPSYNIGNQHPTEEELTLSLLRR